MTTLSVFFAPTLSPVVTVEVCGSTDAVHMVDVPLTDGAILLVALDGDRDLTLWQYATPEDYRPLALVRECDVHPLVWARATAGVPRVSEV